MASKTYALYFPELMNYAWSNLNDNGKVPRPRVIVSDRDTDEKLSSPFVPILRKFKKFPVVFKWPVHTLQVRMQLTGPLDDARALALEELKEVWITRMSRKKHTSVRKK